MNGQRHCATPTGSSVSTAETRYAAVEDLRANVRGQIALADGDHDAAIRLTAEAADLAYIPLTRCNTLPALIEAELAAGCRRTRPRTSTNSRCWASPAGATTWHGRLVLRARFLRLGGDATAAEAVGQEALNVAVGIEAKARIVDGLRGPRRGGRRHRESARKRPACSAPPNIYGTTTDYRRCVSERDADLDALRAALGEDAFQAAYDEGTALSLDEAIAYARRGRGERKRPETGWASLTPAEIRVAELVKDGLSNADIGRRLLCSARTVQAHLTHIYAKLGIASRAELAAQTTQQQS